MIIADFDNGTSGNNSLSPFSSQFVTSLETGFAVGDSGGGVFANFGSGNVLIGINSFNAGGIGGGTGSQYSAYLGATRVSAYSGWIASEIPEPGYAAFAVVLAGGVLALRRKK
jgi:secreted trypsin-like serine protease